MSTWNLGIGDVSEETRSLKDKLASKDSQIAAQQDRIIKQTAEHGDLQERFNDAMHKLSAETQRALQLEAHLRQRTEDLRNEQIASENAKSALNASLEKNKACALELRQMETTLERISSTSDEHHARSLKLEREKASLELRVKELESGVNQRAIPTHTTPGRRVSIRPRSSSLSNFKITTLEQELNDARSLLEKKDAELESAARKLSKLQDDALKGDNSRAATERNWVSEEATLKASLQEMDAELAYLREQQGDGSREEELLKRIEEDDAKISALELMLRGVDDVEAMQNDISRLEGQLKKEERRAALAEELQAELFKAREEALHELDDYRQELQYLLKEQNQRKARDDSFREKAVKTLEECDDPLLSDASCLIDMNTMESQPLSPSPPTQQPEADTDTIIYIERLLSAVERLRGERDSLRRDVQFLESESRFAIEALEAKLSASMSTASNNATMITIDQLRAEMDDMHVQMLIVGQQYEANIRHKNTEVKRLGLHIQGLSVALGHLDGQTNEFTDKIHPSLSPFAVLSPTDHETSQLTLMKLNMEELAEERDQLHQELQTKEALWAQQVDAARMDDHETRGDLEAADYEIETLNAFLQEVESERDSLALQLTNLTSDLQAAQQELSNAETRYTNLQFHQLNAMTSNEATRTLRQHIEELENRVMRRNEQIGVHQHDIRRLETNLQLQEERLAEMSNEQELIMAQKNAMVEDCADARDQRDAALTEVENLEEQLEIVETQNNENTVLVSTLIAVIADTVSSARRRIQATEERATDVQHSRFNNQSFVQRELNERVKTLKEFAREFEEQRTELENARAALLQHQHAMSDFIALINKLQEEKTALEGEVETLRVNNRNGEGDVPKKWESHSNEELDGVQQSTTMGDDNNIKPSTTHVESRHTDEHTDALGSLNERLAETESVLQELRDRYNSSVDNHQRAAEEAEATIRDLQERIDEGDVTLSKLRDHHEQLVNKETTGEQRIAELEEQVTKLQETRDSALERCETLESEIQEVRDKLACLQWEQDTLISGIRDEYQTMQQNLEKKVIAAQGRFEEEARLLDISKVEVARVTLRLAEEITARADAEKAHASSLASATEQVEAAEQTVSQLRKSLMMLQDNLEVVQAELVSSEDEKTSLQQDITTHEAEVQKSKSLIRYLEVQIKESEHSIMTLRGDVERLLAEVARAEKACKAAEVNLSLQNAQHKRETAEFQRELAALRIRPNVEQALHDLEERNNEMEELLRSKCTEIEENDDRVLEMLKEKKKLSTKVESLNRKVQNLQAKLAAAKASSNPSPSDPPATGASHEYPSDSTPLTRNMTPSLALAAQTPQGTTNPFSRLRSATTFTVPQPVSSFSVTPPPSKHKPSERTPSASSQITRPKTPERNRLSNPSFKIRTPEARDTPELDSMATTIVIGKKRSAPDDFEVCENMPAQAFTADGEDVENKTPRVRRVLNTLQSGFTPLRHQNNRPAAPMPSPRRTAPPRSLPYISDMTNTPDVVPPVTDSTTKQSNKRSWLGKIRGSSHPTERPPSSRSLFDRGESS